MKVLPWINHGLSGPANLQATAEKAIWSFTLALPMSHLLDLFRSYYVIMDLDLAEIICSSTSCFWTSRCWDKNRSGSFLNSIAVRLAEGPFLPLALHTVDGTFLSGLQHVLHRNDLKCAAAKWKKTYCGFGRNSEFIVSCCIVQVAPGLVLLLNPAEFLAVWQLWEESNGRIIG